MGAIYREEEVVVYIYFFGGVKYYKKVLDIYKQVPRTHKLALTPSNLDSFTQMGVSSLTWQSRRSPNKG